MRPDKCHCEVAGFCKIYQRQMDAAGIKWCKESTQEKRENYKKFNSSQEEKKTPQRLPNYINPINFYDELPKQKSDIAVCTIPANDIAMEQLNITRKSIKSYAKKCGADYIELSGDQCPEFPMYNKYRLYQITSKYEKTVYLDCDIIVKNNCPNLFETTPNDKLSAHCQKNTIYENQQIETKRNLTEEKNKVFNGTMEVYKHIAETHKLKNTEYLPNGGVLVIPKSVCNLYKQPSQSYQKEWCFDQYYLGGHLDESNFHNLGEEYNNEFIKESFWKKLDSCYIIHVDGSRPQDYREELLRRLVKGKYEKFLPPAAKETDNFHDKWRPAWFYL